MDAVKNLFKSIFGTSYEKQLRHYWPRVEKINQLEHAFEGLSDDALKAKTTEFRKRIADGTDLDALLYEGFATVREAAKRTLGMRHFDVQLIGGMVLHEGQIAEMKTGEGKTLVSTLPAYLNALEGKGVYVVTVNDYLARRDSEWMGQIFRFLGLSVGLIQAGMAPDERLEAYACDITYGTNNEFGFDYLRDNLASDVSQCCQNRRHYAILDEVDSILIDEARTPLIISGPVEDSTAKYIPVAKMVRKLNKEKDFTVEEKQKNVILTEEGIARIEKLLAVKNLYSIEHMDKAHMAVQCLRAVHLFSRDVDYVVKDGEVVLVDEFTGRLMEGRRYSDGLHQAIEAIEGLVIKEESQTLASITFQNYFRMFPKLAGMTGTAATEADEFIRIYGLPVMVIPTNKPMQRLDEADVVYKSKKEKFNAIVAHIAELHEKGQPTLVGTISIENSEHLSVLLKQKGIPHHVLNAKHHEKEAEIIADAGQPRRVTIATNMAGRGTDIVLGEGVKDLGGLYVIGSERHESRRIDNQLRGRSGRQGDSGASRFYVSLEDDLMRLFGSDRIARVMERLGIPDDTPIEHGMVSKSIERAQGKVEKYYFGIRKQILQYDDVMNKQRETIYGLRRSILEEMDLSPRVEVFVSDIVEQAIANYFGEKPQEEKDPELLKEFNLHLQKIFPIDNISELTQAIDFKNKDETDLTAAFMQFYRFRASQFPDQLFEDVVTRRVILMTMDRKWIDHLHIMEVLREGIGLRAYGQRDPLVEYKMEAFDMFTELKLGIAEESMEIINRSVLVDQKAENEGALTPQPKQLQYNKEAGERKPVQKKAGDVGRNDPCPCGSGKKYKKCCMNS